MKAIKTLFFVCGLYDTILGAAFLLFAKPLFQCLNLIPPNQWSYLSFGAAVLIIFGIMFFQIAKNPAANRNLIVYGMLLKIAYCGTVIGVALLATLPTIWAVFGVLDFLFLVGFVVAYRKLGKI